MLKLLGLGFVALFAILMMVSINASYKETHPEPHSDAPAKRDPVSEALYLCNEWSEKHSKLAMGETIAMGELEGLKLPAHHHVVAIDYRSKDQGLLMRTTCEYVDDGTLPVTLVRERSAPR